MKTKTKKILAGLGIGLALGSSAMLTGCSSDITFNQKDLDNAISNVNAYLESTQNNNSEYVKNALNELLINGVNNSIGTKNIAYNINNRHYLFGVETISSNSNYKRNVDGNITKQYYKSTSTFGETEKYLEITPKDNNLFQVDEYVGNTYKTYEKSYKDIYKDSSITYKDYVDVYSNIMIILSDKKYDWNNFICSNDNNIISYKCNAVYSDESGSMNLSIILKFKENKIQSIEVFNSYFDNGFNFADDYSKTITTFDYENELINFDKSSYNINA